MQIEIYTHLVYSIDDLRYECGAPNRTALRSHDPRRQKKASSGTRSSSPSCPTGRPTLVRGFATLTRYTQVLSPQQRLLYYVVLYHHKHTCLLRGMSIGIAATWFYYRRASVIVHVYFSVGHAQVAARLNLECGADGAAPGRPSRRHRRHTTPLVDPPLQSPLAIDALPLERMNTDRPDPGRDALRY